MALPEVRPHPVQQPHPPVLRAAVGPPAVRQMAAQRRPVLMRTFSTTSARETVQLYTDALREAGCDAAEVRDLLDQCWIWRDCYVADSDSEARAAFLPRLTGWLEYVNTIRAHWNPPDPDQEVRAAAHAAAGGGVTVSIPIRPRRSCSWAPRSGWRSRSLSSRSWASSG